MPIKNIIVTTNSFTSDNPNDLIASNTHYVTKLFQKKIPENQISDNALKSYYVDYYHSHIIHGNFENFIKEFRKNYKILYYIRSGLKAIKADKHLKLFNAIFPENKRKKNSYNTKNFDLAFKRFSQKENLVELNYKWLINHPLLLILNEDSINVNIEKHFMTYQNNQRHIKIIQQLCQIINEEFISVTAGDINNIYNRSWHFRTTKSYYYFIENNDIITLYNSFTKQEVIKGRLVANKTDQSFVSNFISKMLA